MAPRTKKLFRTLGIIAVVLLALLMALVGRIDRTPLTEQKFYQQAMAELDSIEIPATQAMQLKSGWAKINITPKGQMPMAGYMKRNHYDSIHDSLYIRIIKFESANQTVALINADLLLFPPALKQRLQEKLEAKGLNTFLYLSASHTHTSIGAWDESLVGQYALGEFDYEWINQTADAILHSIQAIQTMSSSIQYWESNADELVINRIAQQRGKKDGKVRGFFLQRADSSKACLFTFSAHATTITKTNHVLSGDYPSVVIKQLENTEGGVNFAMFMAGMVGSHSFAPMPPEIEFELVQKESSWLIESLTPMSVSTAIDSPIISKVQYTIPFGPAQLRLGNDWKVRNWAFNGVLGGLAGELTYLRIGNILMIGTPCDFSGEIAVTQKLHDYAKAKGLNLIITSFNGNYVGYITYDGHYDSIQRTEVREMNWVGPYHGQYFADMIKKLIDRSPRSTVRGQQTITYED